MTLKNRQITFLLGLRCLGNYGVINHSQLKKYGQTIYH